MNHKPCGLILVPRMIFAGVVLSEAERHPKPPVGG